MADDIHTPALFQTKVADYTGAQFIFICGITLYAALEIYFRYGRK